MEKEHIEILSSLTDLNDAEKFLLNFLKSYPEYRLRVIGSSDKDETAYEHLLNLMSKMWKQYFPKVPFFLEGTSYYLNEDFLSRKIKMLQSDKTSAICRSFSIPTSS